MPDNSEFDWEGLLKRIRKFECTPIIGDEAFVPVRPSTVDIATLWAKEFNYPLGAASELARVAQFITRTASRNPKDALEDVLLQPQRSDVQGEAIPIAVLAALPISLYITTSYDDHLFDALRAKGKQPRRALWSWNKSINAIKNKYEQRGYTFDFDNLTPQAPIIYHFYGHYDAPSTLVLSEDDHLDVLVSIATDPRRLPAAVQDALTTTALLFIGYHLDEWDFRILLRCFNTALSAASLLGNLTVQSPPVSQEGRLEIQDKAFQYLSKYLEHYEVKGVYWGSPEDFSRELHKRAEERGLIWGPSAENRDPVVLLPETRLRIVMGQVFSLDELRTLCVDLDINPDQIAGETIETRARELIAYCRRKGILNRLEQWCHQLRPDASW